MGDLLKGKVAIITGSGRGIGRAHAMAMVAEGAKVVVNDYGVALDGTGSNKEPADDVVAEIKKYGGEAVANYDSIATSEGAANLIKTAIDNFGRLDILVNNAGIFGKFTLPWDITDEELDKMMKTHVYGYFYCAREASKIFIKQKSGRIINTSSEAGLGMPKNSHYGTAKEAVVGLTRCLAHDLKSYGATANAIRPGAGSKRMTETLVSQAADHESAELWKAKLQKELPEGISPLVVYLASDIADYINGCVFVVRMGYIGIYRDPPYVEGNIWKDGNFTPEELAELMPKSLTAKKVR